jgi:hypothetical protein
VRVINDVQIQEPIQTKYIQGGLYAAYPSYAYNLLERWEQLNEWVMASEKYELDWDNPYKYHPGLEEILNPNGDISDRDFQIDLLCPISLKSGSTDTIYNLDPEIIDIGEINFIGIDFHEKANGKAIKDRFVNYKKLGDAFKKIKGEWPVCPEPSTTYTYSRPAPDTVCSSPIFELDNGMTDSYVYSATVLKTVRL